MTAPRFDVAVLGGGFAGLATAARLQAAGASTLVIERHGQPGGCAGFFRSRGFAFDVGATTLVDFEPGGVGGELLEAIGLQLDAELLPGYVAWLPDRKVQLARDPARWKAERLEKLGATEAHRRFWALMDQLAGAFWGASRHGVELPIRGPGDLVRAARCLELEHWPLVRYLGWTLGDALRAFGLRGDAPLVGLLSMLVEDTVHATVDSAPLVNAALGITIRGAGLSRCRSGMYGFWRAMVERYRALGGVLRVGTRALQVSGSHGAFTVQTSRGPFEAVSVVSALPAVLTAQLVPSLSEDLAPYLARDEGALGGAVAVFLGVPDEEVEGQAWTHHQVLTDYEAPLGNGNNMFISVSSPGDHFSAPEGCRAVMLSTHCDLSAWEGLDAAAYSERKEWIEARLIGTARRVYPKLGIHLVGDSTWPGLGTVACTLGSRVVARALLSEGRHEVQRSLVGSRAAAGAR